MQKAHSSYPPHMSLPATSSLMASVPPKKALGEFILDWTALTPSHAEIFL